MVFGTPMFRIDLVDATINFKPTIKSRGFGSAHLFSFPKANKGGSFEQVKTIGPIFELDYLTRNNEVRPLPSTRYCCSQVIYIFRSRYSGPGSGRYGIQHFLPRCTDLRKRHHNSKWTIPFSGARAQGHWGPDQGTGL